MLDIPKINIKQNNFDLARLFFAVVVLFQHFSLLTEIPNFKIFQFCTWLLQPVESFFVISGFLISLSYTRSQSFTSYLNKRIRRILPAYFTVVMLCSLVGFSLSNKINLEYFSVDSLKYVFANLTFLNFVQPSLPGVFVDNPMPGAVNGSLWTIKLEVMFYILLPVLFYLIKRFSLLVLPVIYSLSVLYFYSLQKLSIILNKPVLQELARQLPGYLSYFVCGIGIFLMYEKFRKYKNILLVVSVALYILSKAFVDIFFFFNPIALAIVIIYFCNEFVYLGNWGKYGDFSYGAYIWHFPVIQSLVQLKFNELNSLLFLGIVIAIVAVLSIASWHFIEKPFLKKDSHYRKAES
jgi:peptidoglycan/LPS O-acetylase OafA/YrhL